MTAWHNISAQTRRRPVPWLSTIMALALLLFAASSAFAQTLPNYGGSTTGGTTISNAATAHYTVAGQDKTKISDPVYVQVSQIDGFTLTPNDVLNASITAPAIVGSPFITTLTLTNDSNGPISVGMSIGSAGITALDTLFGAGAWHVVPSGQSCTSGNDLISSGATILQSKSYTVDICGTPLSTAPTSTTFTLTAKDTTTLASSATYTLLPYNPTTTPKLLQATVIINLTTKASLSITKRLVNASGVLSYTTTNQVLGNSGAAPTEFWVWLHVTNEGGNNSGKVYLSDDLSAAGMVFGATPTVNYGTTTLSTTPSGATVYNDLGTSVSTAGATNPSVSYGGVNHSVNVYLDSSNNKLYINIDALAKNESADIYFNANIAGATTVGTLKNYAKGGLYDTATGTNFVSGYSGEGDYVYTQFAKWSMLTTTDATVNFGSSLKPSATYAAGVSNEFKYYLVQAINSGNAADTLNLTDLTAANPSLTGFTMQFWSATGSATSGFTPASSLGTVTTFASVGVGSTNAKYFFVAVAPPQGASSTAADVKVVGASNYASTVTAQVDDILSTYDYGVDLKSANQLGATVVNSTGNHTADTATDTGVAASNDVTAGVAPGAKYAYLLTVKNQGSLAHTYNFSASSVASIASIAYYQMSAGTTSCPATITSAPVTNSGSLAASGTGVYCAVVTVANKSTATPGASFVQFSTSNTENGLSASDELYDELFVAPIISFTTTVTPSAQDVMAGSATQNNYVVTITNTGTVPAIPALNQIVHAITGSTAGTGQIFRITVTPLVGSAYGPASNSQSTNVPNDLTGLSPLGALAVNGTTTVSISVTADKDDLVGDKDVSTLTITGKGAAAPFTGYTTTTGDAGTTVSWTTTVSDYGSLVAVSKVEAIDPTCKVSAPDTASLTWFDGTTSKVYTNVQVQPGYCVIYKVTSTNNTTVPITNVYVTDTIDANTSLVTSTTGGGFDPFWGSASSYTFDATAQSLTTGTYGATIRSSEITSNIGAGASVVYYFEVKVK